MYSTRFEEIANDIEYLRQEIYRGSCIDIYDKHDKDELNDILFSVQSKLRYEVQVILQCYEEEK